MGVHFKRTLVCYLNSVLSKLSRLALTAEPEVQLYLCNSNTVTCHVSLLYLFCVLTLSII